MVVAILYIESKDYPLMNPDWLSHTKLCAAELASIAELTQLSQMQQGGAHSVLKMYHAPKKHVSYKYPL